MPRRLSSWKACKKCKALVDIKVEECPICGSKEFSTEWSGISSSAWQRFDLIANSNNSNGPFQLICNTFAAGYCEFDNVSVREVIQPEVQFATTWAAEESYSLTSGWIPNTPLKISSGTWSVITEQVDGKLSKVLRCDSAGIVYLDTSIVTGSPTEDSYGSWEWVVNKAARANFTRVYVISSSADISTCSGYHLQITTTNQVRLSKSNVSIIFGTVADYISASTWHKFRITRRDTDGQFYAYMDGELIDVTGGYGSTPVTDNTTTTSNYIVFDFDSGDKILLGSLDGQYSFVKYRGVWAP